MFYTIILAAAGTIGSASAQSGYQKTIAYNGNKKISKDYGRPAIVIKTTNINYHDAYFLYKEKQEKIENINHEFDQKIAFVKHDRHLNKRQKERQIEVLQNQRKNEISKVEFQFAQNDHKANSKSFGHDEHKWWTTSFNY